MPTARTWSPLGERPARPRPSAVGMVLAVLFAWPVMVSVPLVYPKYMVLFAFGAAGWFSFQGFRQRALVAVLFPPVALLWLNPLLGGDWFTHSGAAFFLAHAAMALLCAVAAYSFTATEKR
ncbi:MAG: hypothetical protein ACYC3W_10125 [Candidatus Nanopelagicales bacterium]